MESNKGIPFASLVSAIIIGSALYKDFDFQSKTFEKPALAAVYGLGLAISLAFILNSFRKK